MEKIFNFSDFSALYEYNTGATGATGATGEAEKKPKSYNGEDWYPYLETIVTGIITENYAPIVHLAPPNSYKIASDFDSVKSAKTLKEKEAAFEKILSNAAGALNSKELGYEEAKKIVEEYIKVGKKYISALPVLKEKSETKEEEISDAINPLMELLVKNFGENKPS